ncbi:MAG: recombinase family protein [Beijerinckiaceae bacterium]
MSNANLQKKIMRCAIYTRVSSDAGLEQEFNSLDAQREAAEAYIKSQAHEGWKLIKGHYDDGGYSGGSMERPGLRSLLEDIRAGRIDIVVVYKVDRLTRSLSDFARLVDLFDASSVSFVSVTQAFNTTTSMGRLTLNVLLSFAQFEREVTGERIRDKIAASKKKGIWMGGVVPLGYRVEDRKLVIDAEEASTVRMIFETYAELRSLPRLQQFLKDRDIRSRIRQMSDGRTIGGVPITNGPLAAILRNRVYLGEINHKGQSYPGEHAAIITAELFDRVQVILDANKTHKGRKCARSNALLIGKILDDRGNRMSPSHAVKKGVRYRYYVSRVILQGDKASAGSAPRVPAVQIEDFVRAAILRSFPGMFTQPTKLDQDTDQSIQELIAQVVVSSDRIEIRTTRDIPALTRPAARETAHADQTQSGTIAGEDSITIVGPRTLAIVWFGPVKNPRKDILRPSQTCSHPDAPMRAQPRTKLILGIAHARRWLDQIRSGNATVEAIAEREKLSIKNVRTNLTLAFLDPSIIQAAIAGRLPKGYGITRLTSLPAIWSEQRKILGL